MTTKYAELYYCFKLKRFIIFFPDHKAHAQTADAIKRCSPGIKKLARRYNEICVHLGDMKRRSAVHSKKQIPKVLDIDRLFNIDLDESVWEDAGLDLDDGDMPPAWLADEATREGIKAVQLFDRASEELLRLQHEFSALVLWLSEELQAVQSAQFDCKGKSLLFWPASKLYRWELILRF